MRDGESARFSFVEGAIEDHSHQQHYTEHVTDVERISKS